MSKNLKHLKIIIREHYNGRKGGLKKNYAIVEFFYFFMVFTRSIPVVYNPASTMR